MKNIEIKEHPNKDCKIVEIKGIKIPHDFYDPLAKLWATTRKLSKKQFKVDSSSVFFYDDMNSTVYCNFFLNYAMIEGTKIGAATYIGMFEDSFPAIVELFKTVIECFLDDEAFNQYSDLNEKGRNGQKVTRSDFDRIFNSFLKDLGIRP